MTSSPAPALASGVRAAAWALVRTWPRRVALSVLVLVPALVAGLGGFRTVELPPPPQVPAGEPFDLGPAAVRVESFFVSDQVLTGMLPEDAQGWVGVLVELTVHADDEWSLPDDVIAVPTLPGGERVGYGVITQDDSILTRLGPDLPQLVALLYPVADLGAVGGELQVDLRTLTEERSFFEGTMRWYPGEVGATVQVSRTEQIPPAMIDEQ